MKTASLALSAAFALACTARGAQTMNTPDSNGTPETLARSYLAMWNTLDPHGADAVLATDVVGHVNGQTLHGIETFRERVRALAGVYRPARFIVEDVVAAADKAVVRWTFEGTQVGPMQGKPATGRSVRVSGMNLFRVAGGRIVELWVNADDLGELEQLGLLGQ